MDYNWNGHRYFKKYSALNILSYEAWLQFDITQAE